MQFCHWCSKKIKQGRFCGSECLQAAAEMPELINHHFIKTPTKVRSTRRIALGVIGALALIGGSVAALLPSGKVASVPTPVEPGRCGYVAPTLEPTPILIQTAKAPVSAFVFTNTRNADTSRIDAMVQNTLPRLQELYGNMMLDNSDGSAPSGVLSLSFLIQRDGSVKWVSRVGNSFAPVLDSNAIKGLQNLQFNDFPLFMTSMGGEQWTNEIEVKVIYRFGDDTTKTSHGQPDIMPYFKTVTH